MKPPAAYLPAASPALSQADQDALTDLYVRGTPANTLRAYERDLLYITAWKVARFGSALDWPESETTALAFILDHERDLSDAPEDDIARQTAETLIAQRLRKSLACPAPSTLDRRIASWLAFHRMKNLASPFGTPQVKQARSKARRAAARAPAPKSQHPITRDIPGAAAGHLPRQPPRLPRPGNPDAGLGLWWPPALGTDRADARGCVGEGAR